MAFKRKKETKSTVLLVQIIYNKVIAVCIEIMLNHSKKLVKNFNLNTQQKTDNTTIPNKFVCYSATKMKIPFGSQSNFHPSKCCALQTTVFRWDTGQIPSYASNWTLEDNRVSKPLRLWGDCGSVACLFLWKGCPRRSSVVL